MPEIEAGAADSHLATHASCFPPSHTHTEQSCPIYQHGDGGRVPAAHPVPASSGSCGHTNNSWQQAGTGNERCRVRRGQPEAKPGH